MTILPQTKPTLDQTHPEIAAQWSPKNVVPVSSVTAGSNKKSNWICEKGHTWEASVKSRTRGNGCPYCANRKVLLGFNDLATIHPHLADEWSDRNALTPQEIMAGCNKKANWVCEKEHEWEAEIKSRTRLAANGCPYCANRKILVGYNNLFYTHPHLESEWGSSNKINPRTVSYGSGEQIDWLCSKGHEWVAPINRRTGMMTGCPYCSGNKLLLGFNDLKTLRPDIASQWSKNNKKSSSEVAVSSNYKALWQCSLGHEWEAQVYNRTNGQGGCPGCVDLTNPKVEQCLLLAISAFGVAEPHARLYIDWRTRSVMSVDLLLDSKTVVEYDGNFWHKDQESVQRDTDKTHALLSAGYRVVRYRAHPLPLLSIEDDNLIQKSVKWSLDIDYWKAILSADLGLLLDNKVT